VPFPSGHWRRGQGVRGFYSAQAVGLVARGGDGMVEETKVVMDREKAATLDRAALERMLYYLKLTREAEYRIERVLYRQGKIVGGVYVGRGQEAIGVASAIQLGEGDVVLPSHRDFSSFLIRGIPLADILCNWMGRAGGPTRGRENTLHIGDLARGIIPIISPLGDTCPVACGVALHFKMRGKKNVVLVHFGEGTTSRGDVHEAMNFAAVMKLAVIFICNNNGYAYSTPTDKQYAVPRLADRGPAYGMPGVEVDGNDVPAVYDAVQEAIARARDGEGPSFIECKTFRMTGHSAHDAADYVPKELFKEWEAKDPIVRLEQHLLSRRWLSEQDIRRMNDTVKTEVDEAVARAEASPMPEGADAVKGVYCGEECYWKSQVSEHQK
jgi:TPP-dependent pyruvate/acetoin dehydrogenase alpha subunit